jgi:glycine C-acetyltransferase
MMYGAMKDFLTKELQEIKDAGLYKTERIIASPQAAEITLEDGSKVLNFCANNYLGLADNAELVEAAKETLDNYAYGMSSVRFICGTLDIHRELEKLIAKFLGMDDCILYAACFDANGGVFEPFLDKDCAIISDALNHASIIDGVRLCKAARYRYNHADMDDLERCLKESQNCKFRMVATDGVFSMDGDIAKLDVIADLCEKYDALLMVDDSHATGFVGKTGRGSAEHRGVLDKVDVITSTLGKALGGASGGFTAGHQEMIDLLRQRSRPYLFSNTVPPVVIGAALKVFQMLSATTELRDRLEENTMYFRKGMSEAGFDIPDGVHAIVPIMLGKFDNDAKLSQDMAKDLLDEGIYVIGFYYPVVPKGQSRIRVQISAGHNREQLDKAIAAFTKVGKKHGVVA